MKLVFMLFLSIELTSAFAEERNFNYCIGEGGRYNTDEKILGEFFIDDLNNEIHVVFEKTLMATYSIESDSTSSSYRPGEQLLRGILKSGNTPYGRQESEHITVWVPNTSYYDQSEGSMSFSPESSKYSNTIAGHVLMKCEKR